MKSIYLVGALVFACAMAAIHSPAGHAQSLAQFTISGMLLDAQGKPLTFPGENPFTSTHVTLPARVWIYGSETESTPRWQLNVSAHTLQGVFHIGFPVQDGMLELDEFWYSFAVDADRNGIGDNDRFAGRFRLEAVPFAMSMPPRKNFVPFDIKSFGSSGDFLTLSAFWAPVGGVRVNRMMAYISLESPDAEICFGIYDAGGKLVADSGVIAYPGANFSGYVEITLPATIRLKSEKLYFSSQQNRGSAMYIVAAGKFTPESGIIRIAPVSSKLPASINLNQRELSEGSPYSPALILYYTEPDKSTLTSKLETAGTKKGNVRWIPAPRPDAGESAE